MSTDSLDNKEDVRWIQLDVCKFVVSIRDLTRYMSR
jgi:hypothetical protein